MICAKGILLSGGLDCRFAHLFLISMFTLKVQLIKNEKLHLKNAFSLFCLSLSFSLPFWLFILLFEEIYQQLFLLKTLQQTGNHSDLCHCGKK